ncbi:hypothetical protein EYF80_006134 [Liparis tanakae]|uniref:Uncharacterized protein n=1 Tax=Liparis tanakae TaxID=230148 RepID=A0A4Z2J0B6_9TELE|nr:hypothetical protein EYF80_006134 [Liparis tanakae]
MAAPTERDTSVMPGVASFTLECGSQVLKDDIPKSPVPSNRAVFSSNLDGTALRRQCLHRNIAPKTSSDMTTAEQKRSWRAMCKGGNLLITHVLMSGPMVVRSGQAQTVKEKGCASFSSPEMRLCRLPPFTLMLDRVCILESTQYRRWLTMSVRREQEDMFVVIRVFLLLPSVVATEIVFKTPSVQ